MVTRIRVLVAEDEAEVRDVLAAVIATDRRLQLVGTAEEAEGAIALASSEQPDVALVDVRMPGGGGQRAAREIVRRSPPTRVIAVSAFEDAETILGMLRAGAAAYVSKSDRTDEILGAIHGTIAERNESTSELERVVRAFDHWLIRRRERPPLDDLRRARISGLLEPGGTAIRLEPVVALASGVVEGMHADPVFHAVPDRSPTAILADADAVQLLSRVELTILRAALSELAHMPATAWLSVDISGETACCAELLDLLSEAPTGRLVLQVANIERLFGRLEHERAIERWRGCGIRVGLWEAGAGVESLRLLVRARPDFVTLDRSLMRGIEMDRARQKLVRGLVAMSEDLGARAIAGHANSDDEVETFKRIGVPLARGRALQLGSTSTSLVLHEVSR
jgi:DNA-binding NarL/FixJ family response regulator/EAL domain-containing protein (putative c-di-GMP-specific phosphodiesterase class I)